MNNAVMSEAVTVENRDTDDRLVVVSTSCITERPLNIYQNCLCLVTALTWRRGVNIPPLKEN